MICESRSFGDRLISSPYLGRKQVSPDCCLLCFCFSRRDTRKQNLNSLKTFVCFVGTVQPGAKYPHAGEAATNALKLYDGGEVLKSKPGGLKVVVVPLRLIELLTLQSCSSGSLYFDPPAGADTVMVESPHVSVTFAGALSCKTAQR